jgi:hypothetical protein
VRQRMKAGIRTTREDIILIFCVGTIIWVMDVLKEVSCIALPAVVAK